MIKKGLLLFKSPAVVMPTRGLMPAVGCRFIHPRGYNDERDMYSFRFHEINVGLLNARNTDNIAFLFKKHQEEMTDY